MSETPSRRYLFRRTSSTTPSLTRPGLPPALSRLVGPRLRLAALCYALVFLFNIGEHWFWVIFGTPAHETSPGMVVGLVSIVLALALVPLTRKERVSIDALVWLSLSFEVVGSFTISMASISQPFPADITEVWTGIPWACVWVVVYPLTVPARALHALVAGVAATGAAVLALYVNQQLIPAMSDIPDEVWGGLVMMMMICVIWGALLARSIYSLGRQVDAARKRGSYQLEKLLGKGGMGEVWLARHAMLARPAAVKLIRPEVLAGGDGERTAMRRFEREAQATAALESPHSVGLYDFGVAEDGTLYYVMEYLRGIDLETLVERYGPVDPARALHWLGQACHSLAEAHEQGLLHRDIKPANLYACRFGLEVDFLKVLDFGLAKPMDADEVGLTKLTRDTAVAGTPAFMAPEVAVGEDDIDGRADLYALGCVAYWMLTGHLVFEATSSMKMVLAHISSEVVPPSKRTEIRIPDDLEAIVLDCLQKDPADRPQTAEALAQRLGACALAGVWDQQKARNWWRTHLPAMRQP